MKYNPDKHHRRSIRLKGHDYTSPGAYFITLCVHQRECLFGEIVNGEMQLNEFGKLVDAHWQRLPSHFPNLKLDMFVVMPNHLHGILVITEPPCRGAALDHSSSTLTENLNSNATPQPNRSPNSGVAFGQGRSHKLKDKLPNAAPLPPRLTKGSIGAIVLNFKSITTRRINQMRQIRGVPLWQRDYYDRIIRDEKALKFIRQYIQNNPLLWEQDQLHLDNPSDG